MYKNLNKCLCCDNTNLIPVLDLGSQPLANSYPSSIDEYEESYPLCLNLCDTCFHLQLSISVNPDLLFKNYLYVSGTTTTLKQYFHNFAHKTLSYRSNAKTVLDIACNDGSQLNAYKNLGLKTFGIDPAQNLHEISSSNGHTVLCDYFSVSSASLLNQKFDIITAQNVFAHNNDPLTFLKIAETLMDEESLLFIQTSQANMIKNSEFDTIYHEHISFFNTGSMQALLKNSGLFLIDVFKTPIHGTSYVFVISKNTKLVSQTNIHNQLQEEHTNGLYDYDTYKIYANNCYNIVTNFNTCIQEFKYINKKCIGYGAAAKGVVFLNFSKTQLDLVIDDNPLKHNKFIPGMKIPIVSGTILKEYNSNDCVIVPLAWNFYDEIKNRVNQYIKNCTYIKYFPNLFIDK